MLYYPAILRPQWVLKWNDECRESEPHHSKWPTEFLYLSEKESERVLYCKKKKKAIKIWQSTPVRISYNSYFSAYFFFQSKHYFSFTIISIYFFSEHVQNLASAASYSSFVSLRRHGWVGVLLWPCQSVNRQLNAKTVCCLYLGIVWSTSRWLYLFPTITHVTYYAPRRTGQASSRAGPDLPAPNPMDLRDADSRPWNFGTNA